MAKEYIHIDDRKYLKKLLRKNPLEIPNIVKVALKTFHYRYIQKCVGKNSIVGQDTKIINFSNVSIGKHCLIQDNVYFRAGIEGRIKIGDYCAINSFTKLFGHGGIEIGDYTQLGPDCLLTTTTHNYNDRLSRSFKKIEIGKWTWVGAKCLILAGIKIGEYSVIGAGSIVTRDIPDKSVAVGNPARIIKTIDNN